MTYKCEACNWEGYEPIQKIGSPSGFICPKCRNTRIIELCTHPHGECIIPGTFVDLNYCPDCKQEYRTNNNLNK